MCSLLLASVIMFLQTIINLLLLKNYNKFHSFRVRNVLIPFLYLIIWYEFAAWFRPFLILLSGDIETNPGPKPGQSFSICHWNLNSISAHNYTKISLLTVYVLVHNFDIICLSETYLNSETSTDDKNLEILGYCLLRADHPSNNKRGGVCIFYMTTLPLRVLNISYLSECITFEISIGNQVCRFIHLYRSPSQIQEEFQTFNLLLINLLLTFKKKVRFSILFSLTNVLRFQTEASYLLNYHYGQIAHYLLVTLQKMTSFE